MKFHDDTGPSPEYRAFLDAMKEPLLLPDDSTETARAKLEAMHGHPVAKDTVVERLELGGIPCTWIRTPQSADSTSVLVMCHGGGYIAAGGDAYLFYAEMLGRPCRSPVLLIDYRLAPEHLHPAALDDCVAAYRGLLESGISPERVALIGDSCGGTLAITTLLRLRDLGIPMPACAVALGGWFDLAATGDSALHPLGYEPFAHPDFLRARGRDYIGPDGDPLSPYVSPLHAELEGLPPLLLQVGQIDITRDDSVRLAARAGEAGVRVDLSVHPHMVHGFQGLARARIPEAQQALQEVAAFIAARTS
jgi:monoterpene epsilon-lactone hydrolase